MEASLDWTTPLPVAWTQAHGGERSPHTAGRGHQSYYFFFFLVLLFTFSCISSKFLRNLFLEQSSKHALTSGPLSFAFSVSGMISPQISSCLALSLLLGLYSNVTSSKTCLGYQLKHTTLHLLTLLPFPSQHLRSLPCVTCVCALFHSITRI